MKGKTKMILLVEDSEIVKKASALMLKSLNCETDIVETGAQALEKIASKQYDFVFLDIGLPDMDGFTVTKKVRAMEDGTTRSTPIIALTAHTEENFKSSAMEAGMNGFLTKPLLPEKIKKILDEFS